MAREKRDRRQYREGLRGLLFYLSPEDHKLLKLKAVEARTPLQAICVGAVMPLIEEEERKTYRSGLTEWERAEDDVDNAEWELLDAMERVEEATEHLAQCQVRACQLGLFAEHCCPHRLQ